MRAIVAIGCTLVAAAGSAEAKEKCGGSDVKYFDEALAHHLTRAAVPYTIKPGGLVCVPESRAEALRTAQAEVDASFHEVAHFVKDACEEKALVAWATNQGLRFDVRPTRNARNEPSGRMFLLRSFTREEVLSNRKRLEQAPVGATCHGP